MQVMEIILKICNLLNQVDDFVNDVPVKSQEYDEKLSDLYHFAEANKMDAKKAYRFCKELKKVLQERREFKNNVEILREYKNQKQKLNSGIENRKLFITEMKKRVNRLNQPYKNRSYKEDELKEKIG